MVAAHFERNGFPVTSTWFEEPHGPTIQLKDVGARQLQEYALRDLAELRAADMLVFFSENDQTHNRRGGRHVEFGYALALGKPIAVIGPIENIFHHVPHVRRYSSINEFLESILKGGNNGV